MVETPAWQEALATRGWLNLYQPSEEFGTFLTEQQEQVRAALTEIGLVK